MDDVREYNEEHEVILESYRHKKESRLVITSFNEGQYNSTSIDLLDLLSWVNKNKPELWEQV